MTVRAETLIYTVPTRCQRCLDVEDGCCSCTCYISHMNLEVRTVAARPASTFFLQQSKMEASKRPSLSLNGGWKKGVDSMDITQFSFTQLDD